MEKKPQPEVMQNLNYKGLDLLLCIDPDGDAAVYSMPGMVPIFKADVMSQCWHLAKWKIRNNLTRVKILEERKAKSTNE